jgi:hypothetical protein
MRRARGRPALTRQCWQRRGIFFSEQHSKLSDTPDTLRRHDTELGELTADSIHQHGALSDQQITRAVQHQCRLLFC